MSECLPRILIVGGDGLIGRALVQKLRSLGYCVSWTTRQRGVVGAIELSMEKVAFEGSPNLNEYDFIVITAAVTEQAACLSDPQTSYLVNVEAPKVLARAAMAAGVKVVFLSSNLVLGGDQPFLSPAAPLAPVGVYAQMKAEAEQCLRTIPGSSKNLALLRMTKVLDPRLPLLKKWRKLAESGEYITAFCDLVIAPVSLSFVINALAKIVQMDAAGIFHCSGSAEISYSDLARAYLQRIGLDSNLVLPTEGRVINPIAAVSPLHSSLSNDDLDLAKSPWSQPYAEMLTDLVS